jgi:hypothetical protein
MLTDLFVLMTAAAMVITKWMDCQTTLSSIRKVDQEQNPWARKLMRKYGVRSAVYGIFLLQFSIVFISILLLYGASDNNVTKWMYILFGLFISVV